MEGQLLTLEEAQQWGNRATHLDTGVVSNLQLPRARVIWFDMVSSSRLLTKMMVLCRLNPVRMCFSWLWNALFNPRH